MDLYIDLLIIGLAYSVHSWSEANAIDENKSQNAMIKTYQNQQYRILLAKFCVECISLRDLARNDLN